MMAQATTTEGAAPATSVRIVERPGAGLQIHGVIGGTSEQRFLGEGVIRGDVPVPLFTEMFIQFPSPYWDAVQRATAEKMVTAYAVHDDLLDSCKRLMSLVAEAICHGMPITPEVAAARNLAVTTIAKAEGRASSPASP